MTNQAWECPRCKRINAPFNPTCFCSPDNTPKASQHVMDAVNYLSGKGQAQFKPMELPARLPHGYMRSNICSICNGYHDLGRSCMTLALKA